MVGTGKCSVKETITDNKYLQSTGAESFHFKRRDRVKPPVKGDKGLSHADIQISGKRVLSEDRASVNSLQWEQGQKRASVTGWK